MQGHRKLVGQRRFVAQTVPEECPKLDHTGRPLCHFPVAQRQGVTAISPGTRLQVCVLNAHFLGLNYIGFIITFKIK